MALSTSNNFLQTLIGAGPDAFNNLYEVSFTGGHLTDTNTPLKIRCQGINLPQISQETYTSRFVNTFVDWPLAKVNIARTLSLTFRVDANFEAYNSLLSQENTTFNPSLSYTATDIKTLRENGDLFDITVDVINQGITGDNYSTETLAKFKGCWINHISGINYTTDSASPATVEVSINFLEMEDLQSGISGISSGMTVGFDNRV